MGVSRRRTGGLRGDARAPAAAAPPAAARVAPASQHRPLQPLLRGAGAARVARHQPAGELRRRVSSPRGHRAASVPLHGRLRLRVPPPSRSGRGGGLGGAGLAGVLGAWSQPDHAARRAGREWQIPPARHARPAGDAGDAGARPRRGPRRPRGASLRRGPGGRVGARATDRRQGGRLVRAPGDGRSRSAAGLRG